MRKPIPQCPQRSGEAFQGADLLRQVCWTHPIATPKDGEQAAAGGVAQPNSCTPDRGKNTGGMGWPETGASSALFGPRKVLEFMKSYRLIHKVYISYVIDKE
jgi:hypothetical protein